MSVIRNFLRRLNHSSGGQSNLLGIRILQLLLGLVGIILWAILFALYRQWMPKTREAGVYVLHGEWKPPSGFDKSVTFMLALVDPVSTPTLQSQSSDKALNPGHCLLLLDPCWHLSTCDRSLSASERIPDSDRTPPLDRPPCMRHRGVLVY